MYQIKCSIYKSIFFVEIVDKINHKQIIRFLESICNKGQNNKSLFLITDYRNAIIDETSEEPIEKIGFFVNTRMKSTFNHIKWANISIGYLPTTGAIILHELIKGKEIEYEPFTTIEKALSWLRLSNNEFNNLIILEE
jgi:hypothetical protein